MTASEPTLRPYCEGDAPAMAQLYYDSARTLGLRGYSPEQVAVWAPEPADPALVQARAVDGRTTLVAVNAAGQVVAYADLEPNGHLDHLYRSPDAPKGVASRLVDALLAHAKAANMTRIFVEASELARPLFERKGFTLVRRAEFELRGVAIHNYEMELRL